MKDDPYWTLRKKSLELVELSSIKLAFSCSNSGSIRYDPYWTSRKNSLEPIELSTINKVSLVLVSFDFNTGPYELGQSRRLGAYRKHDVIFISIR